MIMLNYNEVIVGNVTKQELVLEVAKRTGLTQAEIKISVEQFLNSLSEMIVEGQSIEIRGFGTFYTKLRKPRPARNPRTGQVIELGERVVPLFKFSNELKKRIDSDEKVSPIINSNVSNKNNSSEDSEDDSLIY